MNSLKLCWCTEESFLFFLTYPHYSLSTSFLYCSLRCCRLLLNLSCPSSGISLFFKKSWLLLVQNGSRLGKTLYQKERSRNFAHLSKALRRRVCGYPSSLRFKFICTVWSRNPSMYVLAKTVTLKSPLLESCLNYWWRKYKTS